MVVGGYTKISSFNLLLKTPKSLQLRTSWLSLQSTPAHLISSMIFYVYFTYPKEDGIGCVCVLRLIASIVKDLGAMIQKSYNFVLTLVHPKCFTNTVTGHKVKLAVALHAMVTIVNTYNRSNDCNGNNTRKTFYLSLLNANQFL